MSKGKTVVDIAKELLKKDPDMKYYQAMEQARRELGEVDRGTVPGVPKGKK